MTNYKTAVAAVVRKTYQEHGLGDKPWGIGKYGCSYAAGCAIGISLSPELAFELDNGSVNNLLFLLRDHENLQLELFGSVDKPPEAIISKLVTLQMLHDTHATSQHHRENARADRDAYKKAIELHFPNVDLTA